MKRVLIVGLSSTAKQAYSIIKSYQLFEVIGFAVDRSYKTVDTFLKCPVYALDEIDSFFNKEEDYLFVAVLWNRLNADRRDLFERLQSEGYHFANIISPHAIIRGEINGENCWVNDFAIIQNDAKINSNVFIMSQTLIGANSKIGAHCFIGAKATIAGKCSVGEQSFIGLSAVVFDERTVGDKCIVGACTAVKRNLPNFSQIKSNSNSSVITQCSADEIEQKLLFTKNKKAF